MGEELWYYELLMDEVGPVPKSQLESLIEDGVLSASDRVRNAASSDWVSVAVFQGGQPSAELDINSFTFASSSDVPEPDLDIDSFNLVGDSELPKSAPKSQPVSVPEAEVPEPAAPTTSYFVRSLGHVLGPMSRSEVIEMARSGSLSLSDEIRIGDLDWESVKSISQISAEVDADSSVESSQVGTQTMRRIGAKATSEAKAKSDSVEKPRATAAAPVRPRKKKRKPKEDTLLKEIFEEEFTEDGELNRDRLAPTTTSAPAAAVPTQSDQPVQSPASPSPAANGAASSFQNPSPPMAPSPMAQTPRFVPSKKKASSSFEMPDIDFKMVGGIGAGLLVVVLLVGGLTGMIPIFSFGVNADEFLATVIREYPAAYEGEAEQWKLFKEKHFSTARKLVQQIGNDPSAGRMKDAANNAYQLLAISWDYKDRIPEAFEKLRKGYIGG